MGEDQKVGSTCMDENFCAEGVPAWINLFTDNFAYETTFFMFGMEEYNLKKLEGALALNATNWTTTDEFLDGIEEVDSGFFPLGSVRSSALGGTNPYRYKTCMPDDS